MTSFGRSLLGSDTFQHQSAHRVEQRFPDMTSRVRRPTAHTRNLGRRHGARRNSPAKDVHVYAGGAGERRIARARRRLHSETLFMWRQNAPRS
ncbi:hypothetical protein SKAU_G00036650 [Synaphobranchus kaupii]|uniref:Uncharacterized protein n=1 Tax=Synaphobranchus kaupii TaxID=118154 RepID=A0A9Q1JGS5_SYNKA|nr:hypothetical protein SKAU_G00036650 [Synaphobranchus kaupii]